MIEGNVANVRFFGAVADGVTDDSAAIQSAVDSLKTTGGTVYFPAGRYIAKGIILHEGINVRLQGKVENPTAGYTDAVKAQVEAGEFAVIDTQADGIFHNFYLDQKGNTAGSNISIVGGMIDFGGRLKSGVKSQIDLNHEGVGDNGAGSTGGCVFACAENILIENVIFKDAYNNHTLQIAGVKNMTIKDCMFAGFMCRPKNKGSANTISLTTETIQIEYTHKGAFGAGDETHFAEGEFYYCSDIKITGCYFGDSDTSGYQLTGLGQHGYNGSANVTGLEVTGNVFDNPYYTAMRFPNYCDVKIENNKFISSVKSYPMGALIDMYSEQGDKSYNGKLEDGSSASILTAYKDGHDGIHNVLISNNEFEISGKSNKRLISIVGTGFSYGARSVANKIMQVKGQTFGKVYTGFVKVSNTVSDVTVKGNKVNVSASGYYKDYLMLFTMVGGLDVSDNTINATNGVSFTSAHNSQTGIKISSALSEKDSNKLTLQTDLTDKFIILPDGNGGTIKVAANDSTVRNLVLYGVEGLKLDVEIDKDGNAVVTVKCAEGKTFAGWVTETGAGYSANGTVKLSGDLTLTAKIK